VERYETLRPGRQGLEDADATKHAYTEGATANVESINARPAPADAQSARGKAIGLFTTVVGTLHLSRALADRTFADEVPEQGFANALTFMH
jgi:TetR/AcrR family transcriptional repressor of nem operon